MTKAEITALATKLGYSITTSATKAVMIKEFMTQQGE